MIRTKDALAHGLEGSLPPCLRVAMFGGKVAWFVYYDGCDRSHSPRSARFCVAYGDVLRYRPLRPPHEDVTGPSIASSSLVLNRTDDPEEAEILWAEACERLREVGRE